MSIVALLPGLKVYGMLLPRLGNVWFMAILRCVDLCCLQCRLRQIAWLSRGSDRGAESYEKHKSIMGVDVDMGRTSRS